MKIKIILLIALCSFALPGLACANLITIGTTNYGGSDYNLIWDDDNNGNSVIWLDYTNALTNWTDQTAWAAGLDSFLTYNIDAAYSVTWDDAAWRLGSTVDGSLSYGFDGTTTAGYNITTSEMGHLFYEELSNLGEYDTSGISQPGYGLQNTGDFHNLIAASWYWSGTEYLYFPETAWTFHMLYGFQDIDYKFHSGYGLAVRSGQVSSAAPVPEPSTFILLGGGLAGLVFVARRKKKA